MPCHLPSLWRYSQQTNEVVGLALTGNTYKMLRTVLV